MRKSSAVRPAGAQRVDRQFVQAAPASGANRALHPSVPSRAFASRSASASGRRRAWSDLIADRPRPAGPSIQRSSTGGLPALHLLRFLPVQQRRLHDQPQARRVVAAHRDRRGRLAERVQRGIAPDPPVGLEVHVRAPCANSSRFSSGTRSRRWMTVVPLDCRPIAMPEPLNCAPAWPMNAQSEVCRTRTSRAGTPSSLQSGDDRLQHVAMVEAADRPGRAHRRTRGRRQ